MKEHHTTPHPNSIYSRIMGEGSPEEKAKFNEWRREINDDAASMLRWRNDGCNSSKENDSTSKSREDLDFS